MSHKPPTSKPKELAPESRLAAPLVRPGKSFLGASIAPPHVPPPPRASPPPDAALHAPKVAPKFKPIVSDTTSSTKSIPSIPQRAENIPIPPARPVALGSASLQPSAAAMEEQPSIVFEEDEPFPTRRSNAAMILPPITSSNTMPNAGGEVMFIADDVRSDGSESLETTTANSSGTFGMNGREQEVQPSATTVSPPLSPQPSTSLSPEAVAGKSLAPPAPASAPKGLSIGDDDRVTAAPPAPTVQLNTLDAVVVRSRASLASSAVSPPLSPQQSTVDALPIGVPRGHDDNTVTSPSGPQNTLDAVVVRSKAHFASSAVSPPSTPQPTALDPTVRSAPQLSPPPSHNVQTSFPGGLVIDDDDDDEDNFSAPAPPPPALPHTAEAVTPPRPVSAPAGPSSVVPETPIALRQMIAAENPSEKGRMEQPVVDGTENVAGSQVSPAKPEMDFSIEPLDYWHQKEEEKREAERIRAKSRRVHVSIDDTVKRLSRPKVPSRDAEPTKARPTNEEHVDGPSQSVGWDAANVPTSDRPNETHYYVTVHVLDAVHSLALPKKATLAAIAESLSLHDIGVPVNSANDHLHWSQGIAGGGRLPGIANMSVLKIVPFVELEEEAARESLVAEHIFAVGHCVAFSEWVLRCSNRISRHVFFDATDVFVDATCTV